MHPTANLREFGIGLLAGAILLADAAAAAPLDLLNGLKPGARAIVARVVSGNTVELKSGKRLRLAGIQAPRLARGGSAVWPLAADAKAALERLIGGKAIRLFHGGRRVDRYGRVIAHVQTGTAPGLWVQGRMLALGLARVRTYADNAALAKEMLRLEARARRARRGIWALPFYRVRHDRRLSGLLDTFQLVDGRVLRVAHTRRWTYLNFAPDWRRDFTISLDRAARRRFRKAGVDLDAMAGKRVRVRGWLFRRNGPMIQATHPAQIEMLD